MALAYYIQIFHLFLSGKASTCGSCYQNVIQKHIPTIKISKTALNKLSTIPESDKPGAFEILSSRIAEAIKYQFNEVCNHPYALHSFDLTLNRILRRDF